MHGSAMKMPRISRGGRKKEQGKHERCSEARKSMKHGKRALRKTNKNKIVKTNDKAYNWIKEIKKVETKEGGILLKNNK